MSYKDNYVNTDNVVQLDISETAIVSSYKCNETMMVFTNRRKPFGLESHLVSFCDTEKVMQLCRKSGFPSKFVYAPLNNEGEAYFCSEGNLGGRTLCVKEIEENGEIHLKLCIVFAKELEDENNNQMEMTN